MGFASAYLANKTISDRLFAGIPEKNTAIIIIIPAFDEPGIINTLDSLNSCTEPPCALELIVLINAPPGAGNSQIEQNNITYRELQAWKKKNKNSFIKLLCHNTGIRSRHDWGVGMARKIAMDEAARRFNSIDNPGGAIVSLDADCSVSDNYLLELYNELYREAGRRACSVYFEHPLEGEMPAEVYNAVSQYELHLRYYYQGLRFSSYPWVFHTLGSALAVKADAYVKAGGMNKRQGAEDFYFIQKLVPSGGFFYLKGPTVIPSARRSLRVPFGTGPVINNMCSSDTKDYLTYNPGGFESLKQLFDNVLQFWEMDPGQADKFPGTLKAGLKEFLHLNHWSAKIREIKDNTSSPDSFRKRFFTWFNMFRVVKYLNFAHNADCPYLGRMPVIQAAARMLEKKGYAAGAYDSRELLGIYRELEK